MSGVGGDADGYADGSAEYELGAAVPRATAVVASQHPPRSRSAHTEEGMKMATGTVKWFNGSGFKALAEGAKVSYDAEQGDKGPAGANVRPL